MSGHTPGKWKAGREDMQSYTGDSGLAYTNIYHKTLKDGFHLGQHLPLVLGRAEGKNNKANARLMATAPELLEACRAALPFLAVHNVLTVGDDGRGNIEVYEQVAAAIEKAESK